jgi:hypothetical protein
VSADEFATSVGRLLHQVGHWEQPRWSAAGKGGLTRAAHLRQLVQRLADFGADAEGGPRREVPLAGAGDLTLPDQLRVMADDLLAAGPAEETLRAAAGEVDQARQRL